ncbi:MAG TPA: hypothetical protein VNI20_04645 [Fimbriimonadaceae bacterium]|nr:hypothetical protein [Fimbriimonadaceae bacterium]
MHQLGIAGQIYSSDYGHYPISTLQLGNKYVKDLAWTRRDPYPDGFVNASIRYWNSISVMGGGRPLRKYKVTFAGFGDFYPVPPMPDFDPSNASHITARDSLLRDYERYVENRESSGWLVSVAEGGGPAIMKDPWQQLTRPILRLTFEGSVVRRPGCLIVSPSVQGYGPVLCYFDPESGDETYGQ